MSIRVDNDNHITSSGRPLIPGVDELTNIVLNQLDGRQAEAAAAIRGVLGADANIEKILSRVRLLEEALGSTLANGFNGNDYRALGASICAEIGKLVSPFLPIEHNSYSQLVAWIIGAKRSHSVEIFTTNYDLLFEEAFERARVPFFDGFSGGSTPFFDPVSVSGDDLPPRWSRLWKLHGSVGWALENGAVVRRGGRASTQLVYPDHLKYDLTQKQPYSSLFERLRDFLLTPDTLLLAIGFSFRDSHVSAVLDEALAMNANTAVFAFQYQPLNAEVAACRLAHDRPNLSVYAADGAVISGVQGPWRLGELPKNWIDIRNSFWGHRVSDGQETFLLGDFSHFAKFCSMAQASEVGQKEELIQIDANQHDAPSGQLVGGRNE